MYLLIVILGLSMVVLGLITIIRSSLKQTRKTNTEVGQYNALLEAGYLNVVNDMGEDLLAVFLKKAWYPHAEKLLTKGFDLNQTQVDGMDPLTYVILQEGRSYPPAVSDKFCRLLLSHGVSQVTSWGLTPLGFAAVVGAPRCAQALIDAGADINKQEGAKGYTPLMIALIHQSTYVGRLLLSSGADLYIENYEGDSVGQLNLKKHPLLIDTTQFPQKNANAIHTYHQHDYRELIRQIKCIINNQPYTYKRPVKGMQEGNADLT